jgi:hypothetical protein
MRYFGLAILLATILPAAYASSGVPGAPSEIEQLHKAFLDPPRDFSPMPFWFWNGKMEGAVVQQEVREMVDQHVYGAFLHGRDGLQTPYLSDAWFDAVGAGLKQAKESGFEFNFLDEYDWPSGEARNIWMKGNHQSEVLAKRPDLRMKTIAYDAKFVDGPQAVDLDQAPESQAIVAARWLGENHIDSSTLVRIDQDAKDGHIHWQVPDGKWVIVQFSLKDARGFDGGYVDLMNPESTKLFFDLVYGQYHRRFGSYFGSTIRYAFSDHEGDYGYRIAWTPQLYKAFEQRTGYDLHKMLPLLIYDGGDTTIKLRNDYLATVSSLYAQSFWSGITNSAEALGIGRTGHAWEESLQLSAALQGSLFSVERGLNPVGVDSLVDWGRQSLNFKVGQSVADYEKRRFVCENQGVQGTDSYLDLEGMRKATNAIGAWGVNLFVPHAFDYDAGRANYPPDWFHQPYWPYFHTYADYTRRISFMNADSHHVTNVLLYYPITTMWADTAPLFSGAAPYQQIGVPVAWKNQSILINDYYTRIILGLSEHQWDYNIADDEYLSKARVENGELIIGPQHFRAVVLPPISVLSRATLEKLKQFHDAGGILLGIRMLPTGSPEAGANDPVIMRGMAGLFGSVAQSGGADTAIQPATSATPGEGSGPTFYIQNSVDDLMETLDANVPKDVRITQGPQDHLFFEHRSREKTDYYWVVNDSDHSRVNRIHFSVKGVPEKWDALTGDRLPLFYTNTNEGTDVRVTLGPWDAYYLVFRPASATKQTATLLATNAEELSDMAPQGGGFRVHVSTPAETHSTFVELRSAGQLYRGTMPASATARPIALDGDWQFRPQPDRISVPYARVNDGPGQQGLELGWDAPAFDDSSWTDLWLSKEQTTIRQWQLIGPFPNTDSAGFAEAYPPEREFDNTKQYDGLSGAVSWQDYSSDEPYLDLNDWDFKMKVSGGSASNVGYIVNFNPLLHTDGKSGIVSYAHTYLYSPRDQQAQFIVAADNWAAVWLNHKQVFAQLRTPFWYELNDNWADRISVELHQGWNEVLVKVGKGGGTPSGFYGFTFRVADSSSTPLTDVVASTTQSRMSAPHEGSEQMRWYRIQVPPGVVAVVPPALKQPYRMLLNGRELHSARNAPVDMQKDLRVHEENTLIVIARKDDPLIDPVQFVSGSTPFALQPWTKTGLANYSGSAIYSKVFLLPAGYSHSRVLLDLGKVSAVADVFVNGSHAGTLVWSPYQLEISRLLRPGKNEIRIVVTDTEANRRAVGASRSILANIDVCGLEGPVRLVPLLEGSITLTRERDAATRILESKALLSPSRGSGLAADCAAQSFRSRRRQAASRAHQRRAWGPSTVSARHRQTGRCRFAGWRECGRGVHPPNAARGLPQAFLHQLRSPASYGCHEGWPLDGRIWPALPLSTLRPIPAGRESHPPSRPPALGSRG